MTWSLDEFSVLFAKELAGDVFPGGVFSAKVSSGHINSERQLNKKATHHVFVFEALFCIKTSCRLLADFRVSPCLTNGSQRGFS